MASLQLRLRRLTELNTLAVMYLSQSPEFTKNRWLICLCIAIAFVQITQLHVHIYNHDPATSEHEHQEQAHYGFDAAEIEHADEAIEINLFQQGLLKNLSLGSQFLAIGAASITVVVPRLSTFEVFQQFSRAPLTAWIIGFRPPPRASPL